MTCTCKTRDGCNGKINDVFKNLRQEEQLCQIALREGFIYVFLRIFVSEFASLNDVLSSFKLYFSLELY